MKHNQYIYNDFITLERAILSCMLQKPKLTEQLKVSAEHFTKYKSTFMFMKTFYEKFKNYDFTLMATVCVDKWKIVNDITELVSMEPTTACFGQYEEYLIKLYETEEVEKENIRQIVKLAVKLKAREISVEEFKKGMEKI